ncbi:MAG: HAD family hydrolase [Oscillospiraceae bacterium]|jgi:Cof subfamily protein (haloacid dehalogenase superfamily)|nr:HAD family hydrolase [Oscillospiraceae bacterium]
MVLKGEILMYNNENNLFEGILLLSDLDGTLLDSKKDIPHRNLEAIKYFKDKGGLFTISTGRCPSSAKNIALKAGVNCSAVTLNGALVYDYEKDEAVIRHTLPDGYKHLIKKIYDAFPQIGIQVYIESNIFVLRSNDVIDKFFIIEKQPYININFENLPNNSNKILIGGSHEMLLKVREYVEHLDMAGMYGMFTDPTYYEILPANVNKGNSALKVAEVYKVKPNNTVAIGDYFNDIDLLKSVGYPITTDNAPKEIKTYANFIAGHCDNGAVADAIEHIERLVRRKGCMPKV